MIALRSETAIVASACTRISRAAERAPESGELSASPGGAVEALR
jgi:hypothetical protein